MSHRGFSLSVGHAARYKSHDSTCAEAAAREKLTANRKTRENISCDSGATDGFTATINKNKAIPGSRKHTWLRWARLMQLLNGNSSDK